MLTCIYTSLLPIKRRHTFFSNRRALFQQIYIYISDDCRDDKLLLYSPLDFEFRVRNLGFERRARGSLNIRDALLR